MQIEEQHGHIMQRNCEKAKHIRKKIFLIGKSFKCKINGVHFTGAVKIKES